MKTINIFLFSLIIFSVTQAQTTYWWNDDVFYEIFVRSFYDSDGNGIGDFKGLTAKLDYLNDGIDSTTSDLGIKGIWLMPITESPSYHGYSVQDYFNVEKDYGTNQDFKNFLNAAHARGIKVIIDLVLNHTSDLNPWFVTARSDPGSMFRSWYRWTNVYPGYNGPWGETVWHPYGGYYYYGLFNSGMPDLNYFNQGVKDEVKQIVTYWLDSVKVDGFRLDAAKYICEEGTVLEDAPSTFAYWREFRNTIKQLNPDAVAVGEVWSASSKVSPYVDGTGLDFCFEFDLATEIINAVKGGSASSLTTKIKTTLPQIYPFAQYGTFLTNHDQQRIYSQLGSNVSQSKLAAAFLLTIPGVPFLYYGEELGMTSATDDPSKRTPMQWTSGANAGFTSGNPWKAVNGNYLTNNVETMSADSNSLFNFYKKIIHIRNASPSLREGGFFPLISSNSNVIVFARYKSPNGEMTVSIHNFSSSDVQNYSFSKNDFTGLPVGAFKLTDLLTNRDAGGMNIANNGVIKSSLTLTLPAKGSMVLKADKLTDVQDKNFVSTFILEQNYPNPFNPITNINFELPSSGAVKVTVLNVLGEKIKTLVDGWMEEGRHNIKFDAQTLNSGVYFYRLEASGYTNTKKMVLIK